MFRNHDLRLAANFSETTATSSRNMDRQTTDTETELQRSSSPHMDIRMSEKQFTDLLATVKPLSVKQGSFVRCTARFDGVKNQEKLNKFILSISIYKDVEGISEENALRELPLLLRGEASIWWKGVQDSVTQWSQAMELMREAFGPKKPAYQIYAELFANKQQINVPTDVFITYTRALLADLPYTHEEDIQIDMIYGLLKMKIQEKIPRDSVSTFSELIYRARQVEEMERDIQMSQQQTFSAGTDNAKQVRRCYQCRIWRHKIKEVRHSKAANKELLRGAVKCHVCGNHGYVCRKCRKCTTTDVRHTAFCAIDNQTLDLFGACSL